MVPVTLLEVHVPTHVCVLHTQDNLFDCVLLLCDDTTITTHEFNYRWVSFVCLQVVAHEISHSWTGNLVTNRTWEEFWSVYEYKVLCVMHMYKTGTHYTCFMVHHPQA